MKKIKMIIEASEKGFSAYAEGITVYTIGDTFEELQTNILEALQLYFEDKGRNITEDDIELVFEGEFPLVLFRV
ncbi:MAG: hypothetical protein MUE85_07740 [Microscillaceae bacterium]|jgi:predicted RNase H-like HicB family nuclease|nr:hypothetical protein [Microscillaceae bacterium]